MPSPERRSEQYVIRIPEASDRVLRGLTTARGLKSRQKIIEPLVEDYAVNFGPVAIRGLESMVDDLSNITDEGPFQLTSFRQANWQEIMEAHQATLTDQFPMLQIDTDEPFVKTGIRISAVSLAIYKTLSVMDGRARVAPRIESLVHGYAQHMSETASQELTAFAQAL